MSIYSSLMTLTGPGLKTFLASRARRGKEDPARLPERQGIASRPRPAGPLIWVHAASVGEAQAAMAIIDRLLAQYSDLHVLITTGTVTSARRLEPALGPRLIHQFVPVDHPRWVAQFLDHWHPAIALWLESELWPNLLAGTKTRGIPAILINARLSDRSYARWRVLRPVMKKILSAFTLVLAQTDKDAERFRYLGADKTIDAGNIKYSAKPLPCSAQDLADLGTAIGRRPLWLFASTHAGEEALACRVHETLKTAFPDLLTVIVPRHPDRRESIRAECESYNLKTLLRGAPKTLPAQDTDIYVADTLGELGLFYRLAPVACIGRSFSDDGGGGHNPIEACVLGCAVLHGPRVQYQQAIFDAMDAEAATLACRDEGALSQTLHRLLSQPESIETLRASGAAFVQKRSRVLDDVFARLGPHLIRALSRSPV